MLLLAILVLPLATGLLCAAIRSRPVLEAFNVVATAFISILGLGLIPNVLKDGSVTALHGLLRADALSALVVALTSFVAFVTSIYTVGFLRRDLALGKITPTQARRFYMLSPLFLFAMLLVALANNLGIMWVAIEGTTLASVLLVAFYNDRASLEAAWKYIIIGSVGISLALFGTIVTYFAAAKTIGPDSAHGLNWSTLNTLAEKFDPRAMRLGFLLILVGYGTKAGLVPMHTWKPDAYSEAPPPAAALLGGAFINCAIYALIRFTILAQKSIGAESTGKLLLGFGLASILVAAPFVLVQRNFRRLLAYSSIDHAGIMVVGLGFGGPLGAFGALLHMTFHAVTKPLMFFCAGNVQQHFSTPFIRKVTGAIHTLPWTGALFLMGTLAVTGTPPFGLFQSEFTILTAGFAAKHFWTGGLFVLGVVTIFAGFLSHMARMNLGTPRSDAPPPGAECPWKLSAMIIVAGCTLLLGLWLPAPLHQLLQEAARIIRGES